ncbi:MAG: GGDEF domain-containing protein [Burkholderiales bacterium]
MTLNTTELGQKVLAHLAERRLPATPENYTRCFIEVRGAADADNAEDNDPSATTQMIRVLESMLAALASATDGMVNDIALHSQQIRAMLQGVADAGDLDEIVDLLDSTLSKSDAMLDTVRAAREDFAEIKQAVNDIKAEMGENLQWTHDERCIGTTGRFAMERALLIEIARAKRGQSKLSVAMVDLDQFHRINERFGQTVGNKYLLHLAMLVKSMLREADILVRYSGEEFLLILPETDCAGAKLVIDRLKAIVGNTPMQFEQHSITTTFSAGLAQLAAEENGYALILRADAALLEAKRAGCDCIRAAAP